MPARPLRDRKGIVLLTMALGILGCDPEVDEVPAPKVVTTTPDRVRIRDLVSRLRGPDAKLRSAAERQLMGMAVMGFVPKDGVRLLRAAAEPAPSGRAGAAAILVRAAAIRPGPDDGPVAVELFSRYTIEARRAALDLLARLPGRDAAEGLMGLVRAHAATGGLPTLPTGTLADNPRHADVFFPDLLGYLDRPELRPSICQIAAAYAEAGLLSDATIRSHAGRLAVAAEARLDALDAAEPVETDPSVRLDSRREACALLDVLAYLATSSVEGILRRALRSSDPAVEAHAAVALLRLDLPVPPGWIADAPANPEAHLWLWGKLKDLNRLDVLSPLACTQEALARSELVVWLTRSEDLGRPPDEIQPMQTMATRVGSLGVRRYVLFRFRVDAPDELAERGWMAGWVSYPPQPEPTVGGLAGSQFVPWNDRSPQDHIAGSLQPQGGSGMEPEPVEDPE